MQKDENRKEHFIKIFSPVSEKKAVGISRAEFEAEFAKRDKITLAIVVVLVVAFITMLLVVVGLAIDAWRWKTNAYKDMEKMLDIKNQELLTNRFNEIDEKISNLQESVNQLSDQITQSSNKEN